MENAEHHDGTAQVQIDEAYLRAGWSVKFFRGILLQMILFGALSFVGPAISDAISNLGGGGLSSPYLANLATSLNYAAGCVVSLLGGPLINKLGIKWACIIAALGMPLAGSAFYVNATSGVSWYLILAKTVSGITNGFLYVAEATAMLSYPYPNDRGFYLGVWSAMRNSGSIIGGGINFGNNHNVSVAGGVATSTYLIFCGIECTGIIWAFLLSPTRRVRRRDGSMVRVPEQLSWKSEFAALWRHLRRPKMQLMFLPAFYSFFLGGTMGTYLSVHFSVRARALSSLLLPSVTVPTVIIYGKLLDTRRWSQPFRAWLAFAIWFVCQAASFCWIGYNYSGFGTNRLALDYGLDGSTWGVAYGPYLLMFVTSYWVQVSMYWILGTFTTDAASSARTGGLFRGFETLGQCVSYAINSQSYIDIRIPFAVHAALLAATVPCMVLLIRMVPEMPADVDVDIGDLVVQGVAAKPQEAEHK
ncbi:uncharacterized protein B0I36DRAFT_251564 [Microdochium trichocladiopsis]|uniref:Membrane protein n=1 Tax=Microdochium trichocladiopsis TaxID=1682393 RepID=A0A9P8XV89_9PEZI|nr:uncharacterized protein B0I36DRAFT_251564 [Microdochium trichocladiopsis]KAH7020808.1 membrane protein [Microdochium trichocladiopsis]